jgi:hypothetical protein
MPHTHWVAGGAVGGLTLGLVTAVSTRDLCENNIGCQLVSGVLGAAVGFTVGALIGGLIPAGGR